MATYGRIIRTSFCLQSNSWRIMISATRVFPPPVGNEYIKFFLCCRDSNIKQSCCHSAKWKRNYQQPRGHVSWCQNACVSFRTLWAQRLRAFPQQKKHLKPSVMVISKVFYNPDGHHPFHPFKPPKLWLPKTGKLLSNVVCVKRYLKYFYSKKGDTDNTPLAALFYPLVTLP